MSAASRSFPPLAFTLYTLHSTPQLCCSLPSFPSLIPFPILPREHREMTERTPTELPVTQKCYLLIFAFLTEYSTFLKRLTHFLKKLSPFLKSLTNDCASHMRFCMRSYVYCPECHSGILVSLSINPQLYWGTCLPLSVQFSAIFRRVNILPLRSTVSRLACPDSLIPRLSFCLALGICRVKFPPLVQFSRLARE